MVYRSRAAGFHKRDFVGVRRQGTNVPRGTLAWLNDPVGRITTFMYDTVTGDLLTMIDSTNAVTPGALPTLKLGAMSVVLNRHAFASPHAKTPRTGSDSRSNRKGPSRTPS